MTRPAEKERCTVECERAPTCTTCHRTKKPIGRDAGCGSDMCDSDCPGYRSEPTPGHLWPGELASLAALGVDS